MCVRKIRSMYDITVCTVRERENGPLIKYIQLRATPTDFLSVVRHFILCTYIFELVEREQSGRQWNRKYIIHVQFYLQRKCACAILAVNDTFPNYIFTEIFLCTNVSYVKFTECYG